MALWNSATLLWGGSKTRQQPVIESILTIFDPSVVENWKFNAILSNNPSNALFFPI
jgi:hypothetical protein